MATIGFQNRKPVQDSSSTLKYSDAILDFGTFHPQDIARQDFQQGLFKLDESDVELPSNSGAGVEDPSKRRLLPYKSASDPSQTRAYAFVRADTTRNFPLGCHGISLLELTPFANWESVSDEVKALAMSTTLISQVSFYAPMARIDEWMVCESGTS